MNERHLLGALEMGDTRIVCATGYEDGTIVSRCEIPATTPEKTVPQISQWFVNKGISAAGICTYGPCVVSPASSDFGTIIEAPDASWSGFDLIGTMRTTLDVPCGLDTDVNAACLGEATYGCAQGLDDVVYVLAASGVGVGVMTGGTLLHGMLHPEAGHVPVVPDHRDPIVDDGTCSYHGTCLEGYLSQAAIEKRWGDISFDELAHDDEAMDILSGYLAQAVYTYMLCYSPRRIIIGGDLAEQTPIVELTRPKVENLLGGLLTTPELEDMDGYLMTSQLGGDAGLKGCLTLAWRALVNRDGHVANGSL